jgi:hypothetical protein
MNYRIIAGTKGGISAFDIRQIRILYEIIIQVKGGTYEFMQYCKR